MTTPNTTPYPPAAIANAIARALANANDPPRPDFDATCSPQTYADLAQNFRSSAWKHMDEADLPQASNKAWGLVAETVKAITAHHGRIIHSHRALRMVVSALARLAADSGDPQTRSLINNAFFIARGLHTNFYEDKDTEDAVLDGLIQCEELSQRLYDLFWPESPTNTTARQ